ncbi:MAG: flavodoxin domain-containing protein [Candidatus Cloacimonetes bacterium]|nr:flavodoxin domain-containing protein [Candidatus Cloacimonadota bacterium]
MNKKILITYDTESGSTREVAEIIGEEMDKLKAESDVRNIVDVDNISEYDTIIIGSPNWYGKPTPKIKKFLKKHNQELMQKPFAFFFTCMCLTKIEGENSPDLSVFQDPQFNIIPKLKNEMNMWEKSHAGSFYIKQLSKIIPDVKPVSVAVFKGGLDFSRLSFFHKIVMKLITLMIKEVQSGEYLNPDAVREWTEKLCVDLLK